MNKQNNLSALIEQQKVDIISKDLLRHIDEYDEGAFFSSSSYNVLSKVGNICALI
jgi:hypothetical protein